MTSWPPSRRRSVMPFPIRPRPIIPSCISGHLPTESWSLAAKTKRRKDAGSVRSQRLRARLRTRRGAGLQRARGREAGGRGPTSNVLQSNSSDPAPALFQRLEIAGRLRADQLREAERLTRNRQLVAWVVDDL